MGPRVPPPKDLRLVAAQAALCASFKERVDRDDSVQAKMTGRNDWQRPLAKRIGISQSYVSNLYTGKCPDMSISILLRIREYVGLPLDVMLGLPPASRTSDPPPADASHTRPRQHR